MQFDPSRAILIVIDVQGNLAQRMFDKEPLFEHIQGLIKAAHAMDIPILLTEQAPDKLGPTIEPLARLLPDEKAVSKTSFSCWGSGSFQERISGSGRREVILCGIETHVCVIQTALDLISQNYTIQVVADAVSSRKESDKETALARMRAHGVDVTSTEMTVTELLKSADHPKFKEILQLIR